MVRWGRQLGAKPHLHPFAPTPTPTPTPQLTVGVGVPHLLARLADGAVLCTDAKNGDKRNGWLPDR